MRQKFICVSRWWGDKYKEKSKLWEDTMKRLKIPYYLEEQKSMSKKKYQVGLNLKPNFVLKCLKKFKRPVLYTDVDMHIYKYPSIFENVNNVDIMLFNWNFEPRVADMICHDILETSSWLLYFNYTPNSIKLLKEWIKALKKKEFEFKADDRVLAMVFSRTNAKDWIKHQWVPFEYSYLPEFFKNTKVSPLIMSHAEKLTSEKEATKDSGIDRIPKRYDEEITFKLSHKPKEAYKYALKIKHPHYRSIKKHLKKMIK